MKWAILFLCCVSAMGATKLGIDKTSFTVNGKKTFLLGISYYAALGAPEEFIDKDLSELKKDGFNWIRVWGDWAAFGNNISAVKADGSPREPYLSRLEGLVKKCDRLGIVVDLTLAREGKPALLRTIEDHQRAVETLVGRLKPYRNWYLDLANERNIRDSRYVPTEELKQLRDGAKALDAKRLITASHSSDMPDLLRSLDDYLKNVRLDFIAVHLPREQGTAAKTESAVRDCLKKMRELGVAVPIMLQEPFRRGYASWNPEAEDFYTDLRGAIRGGAAGWCFHNGSEHNEGEKPRRSFDLRESRMFDQLDPVEKTVARHLKKVEESEKE
jgi:hypothetical protein